MLIRRQQIPMAATDSCPGLGADGIKTRQEGAVTYKFWCGKLVVSSAGNVRPPYKVTGGLQQCLQDCNAEP